MIPRMRISGPDEPDPRWRTAFAYQSELAACVEGWAIGDAVPEPIADVLRVARMLLIDSYYEYSYSLVAITWCLLATEASLKGCMPTKEQRTDTRTFRPLVNEAAGRKRGLITQ